MVPSRQGAPILTNVEIVVALELLCAGQGLDFRLADGPHAGAGVAEAHRRLRLEVDHLEGDRDPG
jgi:histidine ammonia-lyase